MPDLPSRDRVADGPYAPGLRLAGKRSHMPLCPQGPAPGLRFAGKRSHMSLCPQGPAPGQRQDEQEDNALFHRVTYYFNPGLPPFRDKVNKSFAFWHHPLPPSRPPVLLPSLPSLPSLPLLPPPSFSPAPSLWPWRISFLLSVVSKIAPPGNGRTSHALSIDLQVFICHGLNGGSGRPATAGPPWLAAEGGEG